MTKLNTRKLRRALSATVVIIAVSVTLFGLSQRALLPTMPSGDGQALIAVPDGLGSPLPQYAYFLSCSGNYAKIANQTGKVVSQNSIWLAPSTATLRQQNIAKFSGCLVNNVQYSSRDNTLYAAVPADMQTDSLTYWVVGLKAPKFDLVAKAGPFVSLPTLLLSPDGNQLSVEDDSGRFLYRTPDLRPATGSKVLEPLGVSSAARWSNDGVIIDRNQVFSDQGQLLKRVDGYGLLTDALKQQWYVLEREGANGRRFIPMSFADSADNKMLFVAGGEIAANRGDSHSGFLIYDSSGSKIIGTALMPYRASAADPTHFDTPSVHLVPSQNWVIVEEYTWNTVNDSGQSAVQDANNYARFKTGEITLYDIQGKLLRTLQLTPAPGFLGRVIGFSPEGRFMYYGSKDHIYVVDLTGERSVQSVGIKSLSPNQGFPPLAVFLADQ